MNEPGGDDGKGKEKKRDLFPLPILHLARTLFFFSQLEPLRRSRELPININKWQKAQRASGRSEDNAMAVSEGRTINLLLDQ